MACSNLITNGLAVECVNNIAGIKEVFITDFTNVSGITETSNVITSIQMAPGKSFYSFYIRPQSTTGYKENFSANLDNGTSFWTQTLTLDFMRRDTTKRNAIALIGYGQKRLSVIFKDYNDTFWLIGKIDGAVLTTVDSDSGSKRNDKNGYVLTLMAEELESAVEVSPSVITSLGFS